MTDTAPNLLYVERSAERVVVWSPPRTTMRGMWPLAGVAAGCPEMIYKSGQRRIRGGGYLGVNLMGFVELLQCDCVVKRSHSHITTVHNFRP